MIRTRGVDYESIKDIAPGLKAGFYVLAFTHNGPPPPSDTDKARLLQLTMFALDFDPYVNLQDDTVRQEVVAGFTAQLLVQEKQVASS